MPDDTDTLTTAEPSTDSGQTSAPDTSAAPADAAPSTSDTAQGDQPADTSAAPGTPTGDAGSLTPPIASTNTPPAKPPEDWQKRYSDLMSHTDRQTGQWKQRMEAQGREMAQLQQWKQEQESRAKAASLKRYNKDHPEHAKFQSTLQRRDMAQKQLASLQSRNDLSPEQKTAMAEIIRGPLTDDDLREVQEYEEYQRNFQREMASDPRAALAPIIRDEARALFQEELRAMRASADVAHDFADPKLKPLVEEHGQELAKAIQDGVPYEYAKHMMTMFAELQQLRGQSKVLTGKAALADERTRLAKGEASITRDPRAPAPDPYKLALAEATKKGISPASPAFAAILAKF